MHTCPCCGYVEEQTLPHVDLRTNRVHYNGNSTRMVPRAAEVLTVLLDAHPRKIKREDIIYKVWTNNDEIGRSSVDVAVWKARKALRTVAYPGEILCRQGFFLTRNVTS